MTAGTHLGCAPQGSTTESSPAEADVEAGPATVILTMYLSNNHQGTLKRQGLLLMVLEGTQHCISHTARSQREREREHRPGFCLYWGEGEVPGISWVHSFG